MPWNDDNSSDRLWVSLRRDVRASRKSSNFLKQSFFLKGFDYSSGGSEVNWLRSGTS